MYNSYPFETLEIGRAIIAELASISEPPPDQRGTFAIWTSCMKRGVERLSKTGMQCCYSGCGQEVCLDITIWNGTNLLLGVESEWKYNEVPEIKKDFQKLLGCSTSPLKLMITDSGENCFTPYSEAMLKMLREHEHISGMRYLWFDVHGDKRGGGWIDMYQWTATVNGLQEVPATWPHIGQIAFCFLKSAEIQ